MAVLVRLKTWVRSSRKLWPLRPYTPLPKGNDGWMNLWILMVFLWCQCVNWSQRVFQLLESHRTSHPNEMLGLHVTWRSINQQLARRWMQPQHSPRNRGYMWTPWGNGHTAVLFASLGMLLGSVAFVMLLFYVVWLGTSSLTAIIMKVPNLLLKRSNYCTAPLGSDSTFSLMRSVRPVLYHANKWQCVNIRHV